MFSPFSISAAGGKDEADEYKKDDQENTESKEQETAERDAQDQALLSPEAEAIMSGIEPSEAAISKKSTIEIPKSDFPANFEEPEVPTFPTEGEIHV